MYKTKTCDICGKNKEMLEFSEEHKFIETNTEDEVSICRECE